MKTINNILEYHFTEREKTGLFQAGIANGIGGEGRNIEPILRANIELLPGYDNDKADSLFQDILVFSIEHDVDFRLKLGFRKANYKFAKKLFHILHWSSFWKRLSVAIIAYIILTRYGREYYEKRLQSY